MSDEGQFLLATLPPSNRQIRLALGIIAALVVAVLIIAPFADMRLPQLGTFFPVLLTVMIVNDLITSALLLSQFFVVGRMALFVLAISYLFTGLMTVPFMLTYPGAFSPTGLLGAGLQSAIYIAIFYQVAAPHGPASPQIMGDI
jgi:two-component system sensor histidine kinase UhpB